MHTSTTLRRRGGLFRRLIHETSGVDLVEYALLAGIVTSLSVAALSEISTKVAGVYTTTIAQVTNGAGAGGAGGSGGTGGSGGSGGSGGGSGGSGGGSGGNGRGGNP